MSYLLDTNVLIRYLTEDDQKKAVSVEKLLKTSKKTLIISDVALAEIVWVLTSVYSQSREDIISKLGTLISLKSIKVNLKVISKTLLNFKDKKLGWIDAYLLALIQTGKNQGIYSYDQYLDKIPGITRREP